MNKYTIITRNRKIYIKVNIRIFKNYNYCWGYHRIFEVLLLLQLILKY